MYGKVEWEFYDGEPRIARPKDNYIYKNKVEEILENSWRGLEAGLDSNVHAFTFYMGNPLKDGKTGKIFMNPFTDQNITDNSAKTKIMTAIATKLNVLDRVDSQWITDQEFNKDTKDYRIIVKHKYDSDNIMIPDTDRVYPFNLDGKIYPVHREYVKASCGGKSITDTWEGQKENEFWKIDNPQEEKIKAEKEFECSTAYADGYDIMATYCSYSISDKGHFWLRDRGFVHTSSSEKGDYANSLANQYSWCGVYSKGTINSWGGDSYCYEAHVYWSKNPTKYQNNQKTSWTISKSMKIENHDNNDSYVQDSY